MVAFSPTRTPLATRRQIVGQHMPLKTVEPGTRWPSGDSLVIAELDVSVEWVSKLFGTQLIEGVEEGLGSWVGIGGQLPSGRPIELVKYQMQDWFQLRADSASPIRPVLEEFRKVSAISDSQISWVVPSA